MKKFTSISILTSTSLANLNGGETSGSLKRKDDGAIYVSGQSLRSALFNTIRQSNNDKFLSTSEESSGDIKNDWLADLQGYLIPSIQERRWSPIQVSPIEQIREDYSISDMLTRISHKKKEIDKDKVKSLEFTKDKKLEELKKLALDKEYEEINELLLKINQLRDKELKDIKDFNEIDKEIQDKAVAYFKALKKYRNLVEKDVKDNRIANVELIETIYKYSIHIDNFKIGRVENVDFNNIDKKLPVFEIEDLIKDEKRKERVKAILSAILNLNGFAKQARASADISPEFIILANMEFYNHKLQKAIEFNNGELKLEKLESTIEELNDIAKFNNLNDVKIFIGLNSDIISNSDELKKFCEKNKIFFATPTKAVVEAFKDLS